MSYLLGPLAFRNDREFIIEAIQRNSFSFLDAPEEFQADRRIQLIAWKSCAFEAVHEIYAFAGRIFSRLRGDPAQ